MSGLIFGYVDLVGNKIDSLAIKDEIMMSLGKYKLDKWNYICRDNFAFGCGLLDIVDCTNEEVLPYKSKEDNLILLADAIIDNREEFRKLNENRDKYAIVNIDDFEVSPKELYGIFQISCSDEVSEVTIKEINGVEKLGYITKNIYRINFAEIMGIKKEYLKIAIDIAKKIKVYSIIRPTGKYTSEIQFDNIVKIIKNN